MQPWAGSSMEAVYRAVTEVAIDSDSIDKPIDVYSIDGCLLMRQVSPFDAYQQLERGIYIIGNKKVVKQ